MVVDSTSFFAESQINSKLEKVGHNIQLNKFTRQKLNVEPQWYIYSHVIMFLPKSLVLINLHNTVVTLLWHHFAFHSFHCICFLQMSQGILTSWFFHCNAAYQMKWTLRSTSVCCYLMLATQYSTYRRWRTFFLRQILLSEILLYL